MSNIFKLTIDANAMGFEEQATHARIVNQYVDVNDSMRITAPIDRYLVLTNGSAVVDVIPTTAGSCYQIVLMNGGESLIDAYFTMPAEDKALSELDLHTAYPTRSNHPDDLSEWGFIRGAIEDQSDLSNLIDEKNHISIEALPFVDGVLPDMFVTHKPHYIGAVPRPLSEVNSDSVNAKTFGATSNTANLGIKSAINWAVSNNRSVDFDFDAIIKVPSHALTISDAIHSIGQNQKHKYKIIIESGHKIKKGFNLGDGDYSNFEISSEDDEVSVDLGFVGVGDYLSLMRCISATAPKWNIFVDMRGLGGHAIELRKNSSAYVYPDKGARNATGLGDNLTAGLFVESSQVSAECSRFVDNGRNAWITVISQAFLQSSNLQGAKEIGLYASRASTVALSSANLSGSGDTGLWLLNAVIHAGSCTITNSRYDNVYVQRASVLHIYNSNLQNAGRWGINCDEGSTVFAAGSNTSLSAFFGFRVANGGHIVRSGATGTSNLQIENCRTSDGLITNSTVSITTASPLIYADGTAQINDDWNNIRRTGTYRSSGSSAIGVPSANTVWSCQHVEYSPSSATQFATLTNSNGVAYRRRSVGVWQPWITII